jgi:hypothetical protein
MELYSVFTIMLSCCMLLINGSSLFFFSTYVLSQAEQTTIWIEICFFSLTLFGGCMMFKQRHLSEKDYLEKYDNAVLSRPLQTTILLVVTLTAMMINIIIMMSLI